MQRRVDVLAQQRLGAGEVAAPHQDQAEVALARRGLAVILAEHRLADGERFAGQRLGLARSSRVGQRARQLDERDGDVLVPRTEQPPAHREASRSSGSACAGWPMLAVQHAEVVEALRQLHVLGAERAAAERDRLLQQRQRLVVEAPSAGRSGR